MNQRFTKITLISFLIITLIACETPEKSSIETPEKPNIDNLNKQIDNWHQAAIDMDADTYLAMEKPETLKAMYETNKEEVIETLRDLTPLAWEAQQHTLAVAKAEEVKAMLK